MDHYLALPPGTDADDVPGIDTIDPAFHTGKMDKRGTEDTG